MYKYDDFKEWLFSDEGQRTFLGIRDHANQLLDTAGAFQLGKIIEGYAWESMACIDRMVELEEIREISEPGAAAQHRIFTRG